MDGKVTEKEIKFWEKYGGKKSKNKYIDVDDIIVDDYDFCDMRLNTLLREYRANYINLIDLIKKVLNNHEGDNTMIAIGVLESIERRAAELIRLNDQIIAWFGIHCGEEEEKK